MTFPRKTEMTLTTDRVINMINSVLVNSGPGNNVVATAAIK